MAPETGAILLTIFLRHDQSKTVDQINEHLKQTGWYDKFPPDGVEVVSWYVVMGIGQVVTLRVPPDKLRETNRVIEQSAWGGYRTEFYPTYDYKQSGTRSRTIALDLDGPGEPSAPHSTTIGFEVSGLCPA